MPIAFACPHCGKQTNVAESYVGRAGTCSGCGRTITIPAPEPTVSPLSAPAKCHADAVALTVALGILIGGLALLLFPAVQAAREQARRTQCHNSLKNISLSLRHYHEVCNTFPMDVSLGDGLSAADATDPDGTVLVALSRQADDQAGVASAPRSGSRPEPVSFEQRSIELIHVPAPVTGVAVSPDGKLLAVTSGFHRNMGELTVWNLADRTRRFETKRPFGIRSVTFSPDGKLIATGDFEQPAIQRTAPGARSLP